MIIGMNSSISIQLLIFIAVCLIPYCRGIQYNRTGSTKRLQNLTSEDLEEAIQYGINNVLVNDYSQDFITYGHVVTGSEVHGQLIDSQPSLSNDFSSRDTEVLNKASKYLLDRYCWGIAAVQIPCIKKLKKLKLSETSMGKTCLSKYSNQRTCSFKDILKYRRADGTCNNFNRTFWGMSNSAYKRLLNPAYSDGMSQINTKLPNARNLSSNLVIEDSSDFDNNSIERKKTIAIAYWMKFIGHDLSQTVFSAQLKTNKSVNCCDEKDGMLLPPRNRYWSCAPINISKEDSFFSKLRRKCMNYVRSKPAMRTDCTFGPREQLNQATHFLDGSMIYGSTEENMWSLRLKSRGLMLKNNSDGYGIDNELEHMPLAESDACQHGAGTCYKTGDIRANAYPQLAIIHTLWLREHNRLARQLATINPHWDDERLFQEARKIVTASIQHITYNEWLPALLGKNYIMRTDGLKLLPKGYSNEYDDNVDPTVGNSFATAVLPLVNSMISEWIKMYTETRSQNGYISLMENYNRPSNALLNHMEALVRGLSTQNSETVDMQFSQTLTNYMFASYSIDPAKTFGMDILSLDIQRSRDHGIPSYTEFRKYCGFKDILSEHNMTHIMDQASTKKLLEIYNSWTDIDLLVGALFEKHEDDAMVGPTMRCIITEQFIRTRKGDRFFYDSPQVFNERQLAEIRNVSLAGVFCENTYVKMMQQRVFFKPAKSHHLEHCDSSKIPKINLDPWKEIV